MNCDVEFASWSASCRSIRRLITAPARSSVVSVERKENPPTWPWQDDPELRKLAVEHAKRLPEMDREFDRRMNDIRRRLGMPLREGSEAG